MIAKKIKILIKSDGSYLDTILPPITANEDGRTIVQVIAPFPITDIVSVNYSIRPIQATVKGSYLVPTGKFGKDVLADDYTHFQTVADWNVFEIPINAVALEYISKYRAGLVLVSFAITQLQTPYFATNYLGLFSNTQPIPATSYNDGDYFIANEYNFTAHDITWAKGDYAYFYNGKWNKGKSVLKASTPSIELPVDPSLKDAPQLEYDEDVALLLANDLGLLTQRVSQSETDIESAENDINEIDGRVGVNETDIYNLESDVGNIKNGTTIVKKAEQDASGNNIENTYETKEVVSGISTLISSLDLSKLNKEFTSLIEEVSLSLSDVFVVDKGSGARKVSLGTIASYLSTQELQLFTIVEELPNENQNPNTIYLLTTENEEGQNQLLEYIWIANQERWELIGSLEVDLSNYYTKTEVNGLLEDKVDKVAGKELSTNDYTNVDKNKVDLIETEGDGTKYFGDDGQYHDKSTIDELLGNLTTLGFVKRSGTNTYIIDTSTYQPLDADLTSIAGLSGTSGFLKKTSSNTWSLDTSVYITGITKAMVETVLTGTITTHTHNASDIVEDATHMFVTNTEKSTWNGKQNALTAGDGISISGNVISADSGLTVETWSTNMKTLALSDANKLFLCSYTDNQTIIIPTNADVAFPIGTMITFLLTSTYKVTFLGQTVVTLTSIDNLVELATQFGMASVIKTDTNIWQLVGALE